MPEPLRSPKQSRVSAKNRSHPYARPANSHRTRDVGLARSSSLLGTIKSFVTAPLSWLSLGDSQESIDSPQKRRVSGSERSGTPPKAKRVRHDTPEVGGFLDPPSSLFPTTIPAGNHVNGIAPPVRTMSLDLPRPSTVHYEAPLPPSRATSILSRASMSIEPQNKSGLRRSTTRELSMPPPSPFARSYSRSSLTPQPSGATFGPSPRRKPRESTAPPLLPSPTPTFTCPPSDGVKQQGLFPRTPSREMSEGPISVLLGRNRQSMSPVRENSTHNLLVRDAIPVSRTSSSNTVERTLSALESYRTPLHSSRFPSAQPTNEHRPRKVHVPMPSRLSFDHTPEGRREKAKRGPTIIGPYTSGMSGMRKLLARRREELERDAEIEKNGSSRDPTELEGEKEDSETSEDKGKAKENKMEYSGPPNGRQPVNGTSVKSDCQLPRARSPPRHKPDGPYSSLRAPANRVSRSHAPAPRLKKARNKFALDDDDDTQWSMSVEDVKKYQAQASHVQVPITFSQVRSMSETGMQTEADNSSLLRAKTPPLPSQPQTFDSLLSRIGPPSSAPAKSITSFPVVLTSSSQPGDGAPPAQSPETPKLMTSSAPATLPFSLGTDASAPRLVEVGTSPFSSKPATPAPLTSPAPPASVANGVPPFFANTKTQFTPPKIPSGSLFGGISSSTEKNSTEENATEKATASKSAFLPSGVEPEETSKKMEAQKGQKPSPFGEVNRPSILGGSSTTIFSGENAKPGEATHNAPTSEVSPFSGFRNAETSASTGGLKPPFAFGSPATEGAGAIDSGVSMFGAAGKPDSTSTSAADASSKHFNPEAPPRLISAEVPAAKPEAPAAAEPSKQVFSFDASRSAPAFSVEPPKPQFSFGTPTPSTQLTNAPPEAAKSPFSFGAAPSTPPLADKKASFAFGNTSNAPTPGFSFVGAVNTPTTDAPKSVFTGFGNTGTPAFTTAQKPVVSVQAESGDGMEVNGGDRMEESPTRSADKKDPLVSQVTQTSPFVGFGVGTSSGGFNFGQEKPASSTTGFSFGQSKPSTGVTFGFGQTVDKPVTGTDPSPAFNFGQTTNKPPGVISGTGFPFGNSASKSTPQSQLSFGAPLNSTFSGGSASNPTPSPSFSFGQPNPNTSSNTFGQSQRAENGASSTPSSPSLFPQQTTQPLQAQSPSFSFGVPASTTFSASNTAAGASTSATSQPFQFGTSGNAQQQTGGTGGNAMFTLGGAATPPRKVRGLPSRRARRP